MGYVMMMMTEIWKRSNGTHDMDDGEVLLSCIIGLECAMQLTNITKCLLYIHVDTQLFWGYFFIMNYSIVFTVCVCVKRLEIGGN